MFPQCKNLVTTHVNYCNITGFSTHVEMQLDVAFAQASQDGGFVEVGQVSHVLIHEELGRVHLLNLVLLEVLVLENRTPVQ